MPNWNQILDEIRTSGSTHDIIRRKYLRALSDLTGRNTIIYYSGWLQKKGPDGMEVNDADKNGFMTVVHNLDRSKGLDLLLHTPGGDAAATESLVDYLRSMFGANIRAVIPQLALSAGTMIACACKVVLMGKQSSLGPIDPQYRGLPSHGVLEEFQRAALEISRDPSRIPLWQPIIAKYNPTLIGECEKAAEWAHEMVQDWLRTGMFIGESDAAQRAARVAEGLGSHALTKSHARHLSASRCGELGLRVQMLEEDDALQDAVLTVHHATIHTLSATGAYKIIENQVGVAFIQQVQHVVVRE